MAFVSETRQQRLKFAMTMAIRAAAEELGHPSPCLAIENVNAVYLYCAVEQPDCS